MDSDNPVRRGVSGFRSTAPDADLYIAAFELELGDVLLD